ncbi:conjugal transfer protein TraG N-terminal domain-containing protein (plasmid) [Dyella sp. BiH032]|uniref:conjugal transfer protein TraG N-terminal domain-containing protein n=1 Tax=Dyella sp. BiH032 TaxID=3075430 RepID=UPI002893400A|nr:conjugal transfer protein TraG N-terminal domain-containing protein [Dyella sp. BiH032]WNL48407.1 conjugal transfer protein TraG N-terminal domain-containing protein [Dyella sp. BiH032]
MPNLFVKTGKVFEIYSMGDGLYMKRVLDGVASMSNSGLFVSLGALGLLLGLLMVAVKHVSNNAQRTEFGVLFLSFIAFCVIFGMRADVIIHDLGGAPGAVQNGTFPVDNVPYGVAAAGSIVSTLGLTLSEKMEQGYGLPSGGTNLDGTTGFGRSLEWINAVRNWELPEFDDTGSNGIISRFKNNVSYYLANCTFVAAGNGQLNMAKAFNTANPFSFGDTTTGGLGYNNRFITTKWEDANHNITDMDCSAALNQLNADAGSDSLFTAFANASAVRMKRLVPGYPAAQQMRDAFSDIGMAGDEAAAYTMSSAVNAVWSMALRRGSDPSGLDVMTAVMVNQGTEQRATQWGADESMFRQVARPMAAFFESMIYAMAPFMALVVGLGAWGFQKLMTYMVLTIWVALWLPVLSVVNLFQITMAQHGVDAMMQVPPGATALSVTSIAGAANLQHQIVNWLATGATIAAATPAITMMLIFGGAVTASALAGRMQGAEFSNEKMVNPDTVKDAPVMERKAMETHDQMSGTVATGSSELQPKYQTSDIRSAATQSASSELSSASQTFASNASSAVKADWTNKQGQSFSAAHTFDSRATDAQKQLVQWGQQNGFQIDNSNAATFAAMVSSAVAGNFGAAAKIGGNAGLNMAGQSGGSFTENDAKQLSQRIAKSIAEGGDASATIARAIGDTVTQQASLGSESAQSASQGNDYKRSEADLQQKQQNYSETVSASSSLASGQTLTNQSVAHALVERGLGQRVVDQAREHAGAPAFKEAQQRVAEAPWASANAHERDVQAALVALDGQVNSPGSLREGHSADRQRALMEALGAAGGVSGAGVMSAAMSNPDRNAGVSGEVAFGDATRAVQHAGVGTNLNAGQVIGQANGTIAGQGAEEAKGNVIGRAGISDAMADRGTHEGELQQHRQNPDGSELAQRMHGDYKERSLEIGKDLGAYRDAQAEGMMARDTGGLGRAPKSLYNDVLNNGNNTSTSSVVAALEYSYNVGRHQPTDAAVTTINQNADSSFGAMFGRGITQESAANAAFDKDAAAKSTRDFNSELARIERLQGTEFSPQLVAAQAAVSATRMNNGASPYVAERYFEATSKLTDGEKKFLAEWSDKAHNGDAGGGVADISPGAMAAGKNPEGLQFREDRPALSFGPVSPDANGFQTSSSAPQAGAFKFGGAGPVNLMSPSEGSTYESVSVEVGGGGQGVPTMSRAMQSPFTTVERSAAGAGSARAPEDVAASRGPGG